MNLRPNQERNPMTSTLFSNCYINKNCGIPIYYQIKTYILSCIENNTISEGDLLPPEEEICQILNISRPTVRQAIVELSKEGYLERKRAKGTYVKKPKLESQFFSYLTSFNEEISANGHTPSTNVLNLLEKIGEPHICEALELPYNSKVIYLERLRFVDQNPMVYVESYLDANRFHQLIDFDFSSCSLYQVLDETFHVHVSSVNRTIYASLSDKYTSNLFSIKTGSPVLISKTFGKSEQNQTIEYSEACYPGDRNKFDICLKRADL